MLRDRQKVDLGYLARMVVSLGGLAGAIAIRRVTVQIAEIDVLRAQVRRQQDAPCKKSKHSLPPAAPRFDDAADLSYSAIQGFLSNSVISPIKGTADTFRR
jgi:hypothetical protein